MGAEIKNVAPEKIGAVKNPFEIHVHGRRKNPAFYKNLINYPSTGWRQMTFGL